MTSRPIVFVWENLGPSHHDRLRAMHRAGHPVVAIQLFGKSLVYDWEGAEEPPYPVVTLAQNADALGTLALAYRLVRAIRKSGARDVFMCHYEFPSVLLAALALKLSGCRVFTMLDSKFDDYPRHWRITPLKALALKPYDGAMIASERSCAYVTYLGIRADRTAPGYDTLDLERLRGQSGGQSAPPFSERPFLAVARLIPLKNLPTAISAFARYRTEHGGKRRFTIVGSGPQEAELRQQADALGVADAIDFAGAQPSAQVTRAMAGAFALILPSFQETFGFVVLEAMAMGLPAIVSRRAGATDELVDNLVNGFLIDPRDEQQLLAAMLLLDRDEALYRRMAQAALEASERGDAREFVRGAEKLMRL